MMYYNAFNFGNLNIKLQSFFINYYTIKYY